MHNASSSNSEYSESSSVSILGILFFLVVGALLGHCWWIGDPVTTFAIAAIGVGSVVGYWYGIWRTVGTSIGLYTGYQYAALVASQMVPMIEKQFGQPIPASTGILLSGALVGIGVTFVFLIVGIVMFRYSQTLKQYDRYLGFAFGIANSASLVALVLWGLLAAEPKIREFQQFHASQISDQSANLSLRLDQVLIATKSSYLMPALREWNPFDKLPYLKSVKEQLESVIAARSAVDNRRTIPVGAPYSPSSK